MSKTFLELVNEAIDESKVTLDPLTSANFNDPPRTAMYNRFKRWINNAYTELFLARNEWYFRKERTTLVIWPRLHLAGLVTIPSVGDELTAASSGVMFTVKAVHDFEDIEGDTETERTISVEFSSDSNPANLLVREEFEGTDGTTTYAAGYFKGFGRYDFRSDVDNLQAIHPDSVRIYDTPTNYVAGATLPPQGDTVTYVPWEEWRLEYDFYPCTGSYPNVISETPLGSYALYPFPLNSYVLGFDFTRKAPQMSAYDDTPEALPEEYHDYLIWKAVEEFADFDSNPRLFSRAIKHTRQYWNWMDRDQKQEVRFAESKF